MALGRNLLVAYMSWFGGNFEDAILVSEKLIHEDYYSSIHIENYVVDVRDTKLGPETVTRDIPNISEEKLKNLDGLHLMHLYLEVMLEPEMLHYPLWLEERKKFLMLCFHCLKFRFQMAGQLVSTVHRAMLASGTPEGNHDIRKISLLIIFNHLIHHIAQYRSLLGNPGEITSTGV